MGSKLSYAPWLIILFYSLIIECLVIYFFFVETKGPTLEEIAVLFDGKDSAAGIAQVQAQEKAAVISQSKEIEYIE
jgi:hypothetical protein